MILFGLRGCGKSYFGKKFAARAALPFVDTDSFLPSLKDVGEEQFRLLEEKVISSLEAGAIISVGGGAMLFPQNRRSDLGPLVYLRASKELLRERTGHLLPNFEEIYKERITIYDNIEAHRICLQDKSDDEVLNELWAIHLATSLKSPPGVNRMDRQLV